MDALTSAELKILCNADNHHAVVDYEQTSDTLLVDDIELHLDLNLGDDSIGVDLLIESLQQQYADTISTNGSVTDSLLSLQSVKEWLQADGEALPDLFRYLKTLIDERIDVRTAGDQ